MNWTARVMWRLCLIFSCVLINSVVAPAASKQDHWVGTWATAPFAADNTEYHYGSVDTTFREIVHVSIGGPSVRVILTNEFGLDPLTITNANVAISAGGSAIDPNSARSLTFSGRRAITIPIGALVVSDPVDMQLPPNCDM